MVISTGLGAQRPHYQITASPLQEQPQGGNSLGKNCLTNTQPHESQMARKKEEEAVKKSHDSPLRIEPLSSEEAVRYNRIELRCEGEERRSVISAKATLPTHLDNKKKKGNSYRYNNRLERK